MTQTAIPTITDTDQLAAFCARLAQAPYVTVDTEFIREKTYFAQLCLIQAACDEEAAVIDPLAPGIDLAPFYALLNEANALKVFHAARQDVEIFYHATGQAPNRLFDTQVAAMVCGFGESVGYQTLVAKYAKKRLDKAARFTDWARRPLSPRQLGYALDDVLYLRDVYQGLSQQLARNERLDWLEAEMAILTAPETYRVDPGNAWRRIKHRSRDPEFLGRLKALAAWREDEACTRDLPRNRVLRDENLLEIASHPPQDAAGLATMRGLSEKFAHGHQGARLLAALAAATALPKAEMPVDERPGGAPVKDNLLSDLLKLLLKIRCREAGVAPKLVASTSDIERLAREDAPDIPALQGWRHALFGADAMKVKSGELVFQADGDGVKLLSAAISAPE
ncbi:MAG: ribonuclease D [Sphingomonadales bacterium]